MNSTMGCTICLNTTACSLCDLNFGLDSYGDCKCSGIGEGYDSVNNICSFCIDSSCKMCTDNYMTCTQCINNYGLVAAICSQCADANCMKCDANINICSVCTNGYSVDTNGACIVSIPFCPLNCSTCLTSNPSTCTSCIGNRLLVNGNCL